MAAKSPQRPSPSKSRTKAARARGKQPAPDIPVRGVDFIMYCTPRMRRTRSFYQSLFGFKPGAEWTDFWSEFDTKPVTLCLNGPSNKPPWNWQGPAAIALAVHDIHATIRECRRRRVRVLIAPVETSVCWMAFIPDPGGNRICLHQRKDGTAGSTKKENDRETEEWGFGGYY